MKETTLLRDAREASGLTQGKLALVMGIDQSFISQWELGKRTVPQKYLAAMPKPIRTPIVRARIAELEKLL